jgi:adenosine/AMP kinase
MKSVIPKEHTAFITGLHLAVVVCRDAWHINILDIVMCSIVAMQQL